MKQNVFYVRNFQSFNFTLFFLLKISCDIVMDISICMNRRARREMELWKKKKLL